MPSRFAHIDRTATRAGNLLFALILVWLVVAGPASSHPGSLLVPTGLSQRLQAGCGGAETRADFRFVPGVGYAAALVSVGGLDVGCAGSTVAVSVTGHDNRPLASGVSVSSPTGEAIVTLDRAVPAADLERIHVAVGRGR